MSRQSKAVSQFHIGPSGPAAVRACGEKPFAVLCLCVVLFSAAALLLVPIFRESGKALCNALFDASEAVNAYEYRRFPVNAGATPFAAAVLSLLAVIGLYLLALVLRSSILILMLAVGLSWAQAYFGVALPRWANVLAFALLGAALLRTGHSLLPYMAGVAAVSLIVSLLAPGVRIPVENASEEVRDRLAVMGQSLTEGLSLSPSETQKTKHENRLDTESGAPAEDGRTNARDYRYEQKTEQEISKPDRIDYLKIAAIFLAIAALLLIPFLPFILLDSRRKKASARREKFASDDPSEAIRAMFLYLIAWLESCGHGAGNLPFSAWGTELRMPQPYLTQYERAAALWSEAVYSEHTMTAAQRDEMRQLLNEAERVLYDAADRKTRFRLNYLECLREGKDVL